MPRQQAPAATLLNLVRQTPLDNTAGPHLVTIAKWLDRHPKFQRTPVSQGVPRGFARYFDHAVPRATRDQLRKAHSSFMGEHLVPLAQVMRRLGERGHKLFELKHDEVFKHTGHSKIAGEPVFIGEPYGSEAAMIADCCTLMGFLRCPVTFDRRAHRLSHPSCVRVAVWFTLSTVALPPKPLTFRQSVRRDYENMLEMNARRAAHARQCTDSAAEPCHVLAV